MTLLQQYRQVLLLIFLLLKKGGKTAQPMQYKGERKKKRYEQIEIEERHREVQEFPSLLHRPLLAVQPHHE